MAHEFLETTKSRYKEFADVTIVELLGFSNVPSYYDFYLNSRADTVKQAMENLAKSQKIVDDQENDIGISKKKYEQAKNELTALKNKPKEIFDQKQAKQEELSALTKFNSSNGDEPTLIDDNAKTDIVINDSTKPDISVDDNSQDHPRCSMTYFHIDWY